uniref:MGC81740 protein n=1 Tax=Xenopus laevis TaxID=8355 RepID=Q68F46_XENLA|nr:MGC81740 protein [Xenopus laevis]
MYRALYAFRSPEANSLQFGAGESFLILERSNLHWWLASRCSSGETGYVPASYLERIQVQEQDVVLQSIDRAIETIHNAAMKNGGKYNLEQRDVLQKLIHHRKETQTRKNHSPSSQSNSITASSSEHHLDSGRQSNGVNRTERHMSLPNPEFQLEESNLYQIPPQPRRAAPVTPPPPEKQRNLQNALCTKSMIDKSMSNASNPSISSLGGV